MSEIEVDIAVIGSGFGGSLAAILLQKIGLRPVLIDRGSHPRFAIGESSTPVTNLVLEDLARRYDLPRIAPLANYARWKRAYPDIVCGLKRGFTYIHHEFDQDFSPRDDHANELLVAASVGVEDADTHWLRSDFDKFIADEAVAAGVPYFDQTSIHQLTARGNAWELTCESKTEPMSIRAQFLIDASGEGAFLARNLGIGPHPADLKTRSRGLFSHFTGVARWGDLYSARGGRTTDHPYPCDDAALHHCFDGGWMWVLPFDNGVTSAGFSLDPDRFPKEAAGNAEAEWSTLMARLPAVAEQFANANPIVPWRQTGRMQRRWARSAGPNWVLLPNTAAFHDPFYSTGNSFTLIGIDRLIAILERSWGRPELAEELQQFDALVQAEVDFVDGVVSGSFAGFRQFERMIAMSLFYFATSIWSEEERRAGRMTRGGAFLSADQPALRSALHQAAIDVRDPNVSARELTERILAAVAPFNRVGLGNPARLNMYPYEV